MDLVPAGRQLCFCILHCINHLTEFVRFICQQSGHLCSKLNLRAHTCSHNLLFIWWYMIHNHHCTSDISPFFFNRKNPVGFLFTHCLAEANPFGISHTSPLWLLQAVRLLCICTLYLLELWRCAILPTTALQRYSNEAIKDEMSPNIWELYFLESYKAHWYMDKWIASTVYVLSSELFSWK